MEFRYQNYDIGMEQKVQRGFIIEEDFYPTQIDDDFDDGPLRIEEIQDEIPTESQPKITTTPKNENLEPQNTKKNEKPIDPSDLSTWAQDLLDLMDNSISQLEALKIKKPKEYFDETLEEPVCKVKGISSKDVVVGKKKNKKMEDESDDEGDEIEKIEDVEVLSEMLNTSYEYETRRRIRMRIRTLNKLKESDTNSFNANLRKSRELAIPIKSPMDEGYVSFSSPISPVREVFTTAKMGDRYVNGVNLEDIDDELQLHNLLDGCEDIDERKLIRNRLRDVMGRHRAEREEMIRKREQDREDLLRRRVADSDEHKRRTLAMYDAMAKSAPAGANKNIDISILRTGDLPNDCDEAISMKENLYSGANSNFTWNASMKSVAGNSSWTSADGMSTAYVSCQAEQRVLHVASAQPVQAHQTLDLVEEAIRDRQRSSDEQKQRTLAAFDRAARSAPAGMARIVDFDNITKEDISRSQIATRASATFGMRGGVPNTATAAVPQVLPRYGEPVRDLEEEAIRKRKAEADERKRRTLAAYDSAARSRPAGQPVSVYIPATEGIDPVITVVERPKFGSRPNTPSAQQQPQQPTGPVWKAPGQQLPQQPARPGWKPPGQQQQQQVQQQPQSPQQNAAKPGWRSPGPQSPSPQQQQQQPPPSGRPGWKPPGQQPRPEPQVYRPQSPQSPQQQPKQQPQWYKPPQQQINRPPPLQRQPEAPSPPPKPQPQVYKPQAPQMNRPQPLQQQQPVQQQQAGRQQMNIKTQSVRTVSNPYENEAKNTESSVRTVTTTTKSVQPVVQQVQRQMVTTQSTTQRTMTQQQQRVQPQQRYYEEEDDEEEEEEEEEEESD